VQPSNGQHEPQRESAGARATPWLRRLLWPPDPIAGILLLAALFDWISGNPVHALFLGIVGVALGRETLRRRRARAVRSSPVAFPAAEDDRASHSRTPGGVVLIGGGGSIALSRSAQDSDTHRAATAGYRAALFAVGGVVYAVVVASFARYSWPATVAVASLGAAVVTWGWEGRPEAPPSRARLPRRGVIAWAAVFVASALWELSALLMQPTLTTDSPIHPTISVLSDPVLASFAGRIIVLLLWLGAGWYVIRRGNG
jgi:hypothetical protein